MGKLVVLDPGHGGKDPGAVNGTLLEKEQTLALALAVRDTLAGQDVTVRLTRSADVFVELGKRAKLANQMGAELFVSLHRNSFTAAAANGAEIYIHTGADTQTQDKAAEMLARLAAAGIQSNRGVKRGNYRVLRETAMPAMLIELGFISNKQDNRLWTSHFGKYTAAVAQGICAALGASWREKGHPELHDCPVRIARL